jgi:hypothetical protein
VRATVSVRVRTRVWGVWEAGNEGSGARWTCSRVVFDDGLWERGKEGKGNEI